MKNTSVNNNYKIFILFLCVCFCACVFSIVFDAIREHQIYAASWTSQAVAPTTVDANGYTVIENEKHLAYLISNLKEDGKYRVGRNLNMSGYTWPGIGNATSSKTFKGIFDGGGFVISNITTETTWSSTGLFGNVSGATISNVSLSSCTIKGSSQVGTLVGNTEGATKIENIVLTNCQVEAIYYSTGKWVDIGGVVGIAHGTTTIENVYNNSGSVKSSVNSTNSHDIYMGGIVGHTKESVVVKNCINEVPVTNTTKIGTTKSLFAGGIVGYSYGVVSLCGNTGNVSAGNDSVAWSYAGGIVAYGQANITDCFNKGNVTSLVKKTKNFKESSYGDWFELDDDVYTVPLGGGGGDSGDSGDSGGSSSSGEGIPSNKDGMIGLYRSASWHVEGDYSYSLESYSGSTWYEAWHLIDAQTFESKNNAYAGGIVGYSTQTITNCYSSGTIIGGGKFNQALLYNLFYKEYSTTVSSDYDYECPESYYNYFNCKAVNSTILYVGPICGNITNKNLTNTYFSGSVYTNLYINNNDTKTTKLSYSNITKYNGTKNENGSDDDIGDFSFSINTGDSLDKFTATATATSISNTSTLSYSTILTSIAIPYASSSFKVISSSDVKKASLGNSWAVNASINNGYPFLKSMSWAYAS